MSVIKISIILFVIIVSSSAIYEINKCCPDGEMYSVIEGKVKCVPVNNSSSKYYWLPENISESVINNLTINFSDAQCSIDVDWAEDFTLYFNKSSVLLKDKIDNMTFEDSFCLEKIFQNEYKIVARECPCLEQICIPKCCGKGKHLNDSNYCINSEKTADWQMKTLNEIITEKYKMVYRFPNCKSTNKLSKYVEKYELNSDGSISTSVKSFIRPEEYCGDLKQLVDGSKVETIIACFEEIVITTESEIYGVMSLVAAFFSLLTFIILCWIPELGGSPKWSVAIQMMCFFIAYLSLGYQQISPSLFGMTFCKIIGFVMQFSFLASFFWSNVMCIDLTRTFSNVRAVDRTRQNKTRNFIKYSIYAWGGSLLITLATAFVEFSSIIHESSDLKPNIGEATCWFLKSSAIWLYFFGPIGILLLMNLGSFIYTSFKILKIKRETKALQYDDNKKRNHKKNEQRFSLYLKMVMLMGIPWLSEIISWAVDDSTTTWRYIFYISDFINIMRAVFLFVMFCCKKKVWIKILNTLPCIGRFEKYLSSYFRGNSSMDTSVEERGTVSTNPGSSDYPANNISYITPKSNEN